ncbi:MAG TPA: ADOP family duplicated permease, partial [Longimicrobiaceae bacterium]
MRLRDRTGAQPFWRRYLRFGGPDVAADVDDELAFHLEMLVDENLARGMAPEEARRAALKRFGDRGRVERECREIGEQRERAIRRGDRLDALRGDLRFAVRQLRAHRATTLVAVVTLALGIGAVTAIFSVVHSVLLRPLPYADADRLAVVSETWHGSTAPVSAGHFSDWRARSTSFESLAAFEGGTFTLSAPGREPERVYGGRVTADFFRAAEMRPALGRWLLPGEDRPGSGRVVVLSHPLWMRLGADPGVVGTTLRLNGEPHTVVGVAPRAYTLTSLDEALWVPMAWTAEARSDYDSHGLFVLGKLKPGVTRGRAEAEMVRLTAAINTSHPEQPALRARSARVRDFREVLVGGYRRQLLVLLASVGLVLLLAVVNVANLLLARARTRQKEISIRAALGAGRGRIVRQLLTESVVLSLAGGAAGLAVAWLGVRFLVRMGPAAVPRLEQAELSVPVLAFAFAAAVGSGLLFGLAPALRAGRVDLQGTLREGGRTAAARPARDRLRGALVAAELALALVLLVGAGLLVRSSVLLGRVPAGFEPSGVLTARLTLPGAAYPDARRVADAYARVVEELRALPGVREAAAVNSLPMGDESSNVGLDVEGRAFAPGEAPQVDFRVATPGYFEAMRIPLREGRAPDERDHERAPRVALVNETLARRLWPGESALGKRISCCDGGDRTEWREVVGVVGAVRHFGLRNEPRPEIHLPFRQAPPATWDWSERSMTLVVRAADPAALAPAVRRVVRSLHPA